MFVLSNFRYFMSSQEEYMICLTVIVNPNHFCEQLQLVIETKEDV